MPDFSEKKVKLNSKPDLEFLKYELNVEKPKKDWIAVQVLENFYFIYFFMYFIQHCFICRSSDSTVSEDVGIEPRTVATFALAVRRSNHSARSHPVMIKLTTIPDCHYLTFLLSKTMICCRIIRHCFRMATPLLFTLSKNQFYLLGQDLFEGIDQLEKRWVDSGIIR